MKNPIKQGDIVKALAGRDNGKYFLVVFTKDDIAYIVDGKRRKVLKPKKKNVKHIKCVESESQKELAQRIHQGQLIGNQKVNRAIMTVQQKIQED